MIMHWGCGTGQYSLSLNIPLEKASSTLIPGQMSISRLFLGESLSLESAMANHNVYRVFKTDFQRILPFCRLDELHLQNWLQFTSEEMLCLILLQLAFSVWLLSLFTVFSRFKGWLSVVFNNVILHLFAHWRWLLKWDPEWLNLGRLQSFARAIQEQGGDKIYWDYIDGTHRWIAKSIQHQRSWFSGHKWYHSFAMQSVVTPDELITSLSDPYTENCHDSEILEQSELQARLWDVFSPFSPLYSYSYIC